MVGYERFLSPFCSRCCCVLRSDLWNITWCVLQVGYKTERISRGKFAEIYATERSFTEEEEQFWSETAMQVGVRAR